MLAHHMETLAGMIGTHDPLQYLLRMSGLIDVALMFAVLCYPASRVFLLVLGWKIAIESLYPLSGDYSLNGSPPALILSGWGIMPAPAILATNCRVGRLSSRPDAVSARARQIPQKTC